MKILHTSDWHLGHVLHTESQEEAQRSMLRQMADIAQREQPDAFVISGDVFDTTQPSASVQQMLANALVALHQACPQMTIVCIAGNHDSGSKHMIYHRPWRMLNVHMLGHIVKDSPLEDYIVPIAGRGYVVAVPFAADRYLPEDVYRALWDKVCEVNMEGLPVVLAAHTSVMNADSRGHEFSTEDNIGGLHCQDIDIFGDGYDYIALGHIHKQQQLDPSGRVWYCGTPIAVSFDECYSGNRHGVLLVECAAHGAPVSVTHIPIDNVTPLVNLPTEGYASWEDARLLLQDFDPDIPALIRLNVEVEHHLPPGANDEAHRMVADKRCRLCLVNSKRKESLQQEGPVHTLTATELKQMDCMEVARMYIEARGETFDAELEEMLREVSEEMNTNRD